MINPHSYDYVRSHQDELRRDAADHKPRRVARRRGSPQRGGPRTALARLFVAAGARLAPSDRGFVVGARVIVLPSQSDPRSRERGLTTAG